MFAALVRYGHPVRRINADDKPVAPRPVSVLKPLCGHEPRLFANSSSDHNDMVAGLAQTAHMDEAELLRIIRALTEGVTEIYCHPAIAGPLPLSGAMRHYRHHAELEALLSPRVAALLESQGIRQGGFSDVFNRAGTGASRYDLARASTG